MKNVSPLQPGETDRRSQVHPSCWEGHSRRWMPLQLPRFNELARNGRSPATTTRNTKTVDDDDPFPRSRRRRLPFSTSSCSKMDGYRFVSPIIIIKKRIRRPKFSTDRSPPRVQHAPSAGNGRARALMVAILKRENRDGRKRRPTFWSNLPGDCRLFFAVGPLSRRTALHRI